MRSPQLGPVPASEGAERHSPHGHLCPSCVLRGPAKGQKAVGPRQGLAGHPQDFRHPFKQRFLPCGSGSSLGTQGKLAMSAGAAGPTESRNVKTIAHRRTASCRSPSRAQRGAERSRRPSGRKPHAGALPGRQPSRCVCGTGPPSDRAARSPGAERTPARQGSPEWGGRDPRGGSERCPTAPTPRRLPPGRTAASAPGPPAGPARGGASPRSPYLSTPRRHGAARSLGPPGGGVAGCGSGRGERRPRAGAGLGEPADKAARRSGYIPRSVRCCPVTQSLRRARSTIGEKTVPCTCTQCTTGTARCAPGGAEQSAVLSRPSGAVPAPGACTCCRGARSAAEPLGAEVSLSG